MTCADTPSKFAALSGPLLTVTANEAAAQSLPAPPVDPDRSSGSDAHGPMTVGPAMTKGELVAAAPRERQPHCSATLLVLIEATRRIEQEAAAFEEVPAVSADDGRDDSLRNDVDQHRCRRDREGLASVSHRDGDLVLPTRL